MTRNAAQIEALVVGGIDAALLAFYRHTRQAARLLMALLPLAMLLVGSCKTSQVAGAYGSNAGPAQFRVALFPDQVNFTGDHYYPARGYIERARKFVGGAPQALSLLTEKEIGYLFGAPDMQRRDAEARVWQYKTDTCVVDLYFYGTGDDSTVRYVDARSRSGDATASDRCIRNVLKSGVKI